MAGSNIIQLAIQLRDQASAALARLTGQTSRANNNFNRDLQRRGQASRAMAQLGIRGERQIQAEIRASERALLNLRRSGIATQNELARATERHRARVRELNAEMRGTSKAAAAMRGMAAIGAGITAGVATLKSPIDRTWAFDKQLTYLANTMYEGGSIAEKTTGIATINETIRKAVASSGGSREDAVAALAAMVSSGAVNAQDAQTVLPSLMAASSASGATAEEVATVTVKALQNGFKLDDIPELLDRAVKSGKDGGFEFRDMARWLPQLLAQGQAVGMAGDKDKFSQILSGAQIAFTAAGSADEAGNNLANLLTKVISEDTKNKAKNITINGREGFDYYKSLDRRMAKGMSSMEAFVDITREVAAKDKKSQQLMKELAKAGNTEEAIAILESRKQLFEGAAVSQLVSDRQAFAALIPIMKNPQMMRGLMEGQKNAKGTIAQDNAFILQRGWAQAERAKALAADAEYRAMSPAAEKVGAAAGKAADAAAGNPEWASALSGAVTALKALAAAAGAAGLATIAFGGGLGGLGTAIRGLATAVGKASGALGVFAAGLGGWSYGTQVYNNLDESASGREYADAIGEVGTRVMATLGSDFAQDAIARREADGTARSTGFWSGLYDVIGEGVGRAMAAMGNDNAQGYLEINEQRAAMIAAEEAEAARVMRVAVDKHATTQATQARDMDAAAQRMQAAAATMERAASQAQRVEVSVQNGNIVAAQQEAAARDARRN